MSSDAYSYTFCCTDSSRVDPGWAGAEWISAAWGCTPAIKGVSGENVEISRRRDGPLRKSGGAASALKWDAREGGQKRARKVLKRRHPPGRPRLEKFRLFALR